MFFDTEKYVSDSILSKLQKRKVVCWNNGELESLKIVKGEYTSFQVPNLITKITYPANPNRDYGLTVYVHFVEYLVNKKIKENKIVVKKFKDYEKVYFNVLDSLNFETEAERFYKNWLRRKDFNDARKKGKFGKFSNSNH